MVQGNPAQDVRDSRWTAARGGSLNLNDVAGRVTDHTGCTGDFTH